jgi:hypothetical protein
MKNIFLLPTEEISRLVKNNEGKLKLTIQTLSFDDIIGCYPQNLYITSDEEIKEGDWCIDTFKNGKIIDVFKCTEEQLLNIQIGTDTLNYKIIFSTDPKLIADGIQAIDDTFLEWFVRNPSCEFVEVVSELKAFDKNDLCVSSAIYDTDYTKMIYYIIPQEEPKQLSIKDLDESTLQERISLGLDRELQRQKDAGKKFISDAEIDAIVDQVIKEELEKTKSFKTENISEEPKQEESKQETLEEAAENWVRKPIIGTRRESFIAGAEWQAKRMYSEGEVLKLFNKFSNRDGNHEDEQRTKNWFEQFKKK